MRVLDQALLGELEASWRAQGADIAEILAPGLGDDAITALVGPLGLTLPEEARIWWGWHDGVTEATANGWQIGPSLGFYSLAEAVDEYRWIDDNMEERDFPRSWLPLTADEGGPLAVDCAADPVVAPVKSIDFEVDIFPGGDSLGDVVELWIEAMSTGAWSWNPAGYWDRDLDRAPARASRMHVL